MKAMSALKTPSDALAVFAMPNEQTLSQSKLILALGEYSRSWKPGHNHSPYVTGLAFKISFVRLIRLIVTTQK